jgi:nucleoside-diphosphate-sugar epimerase
MSDTRTCFVTGAAGFIGRFLCRNLREQGCTVRAMMRYAVDGPWDASWTCCLGADPIPDAALAGVDTVFHLAGIAHAMPTVDDEARYRSVNIEASEALALAAAHAGVKQFVFFSSVKAAGDPGERCVDESWETLPDDSYGCTKREAERRLLAIGKRTGMHMAVLRPALVYGPGVKGNLLRLLQAIEAGRFPPVPEMGNRRSMVHVEDLVDAAWLAATSSQSDGQIYIVSDGQPFSTRQLYEWMAVALGRKVARWAIPAIVLRGGGYIGDFVERLSGRACALNSAVVQRLLGSACYISDKLRTELGWEPRRHFRDSLPDMVREYRKFCREAAA